MRQALENLIGNALKYAEEDDIIRIEMSDKSRQIINRFFGMPEQQDYVLKLSAENGIFTARIEL